jgi:hypothetical protein
VFAETFILKISLEIGFWMIPVSMNKPKTTYISLSVTGCHVLTGDRSEKRYLLNVDITVRTCSFLERSVESGPY